MYASYFDVTNFENISYHFSDSYNTKKLPSLPDPKTAKRRFTRFKMQRRGYGCC